MIHFDAVHFAQQHFGMRHFGEGGPASTPFFGYMPPVVWLYKDSRVTVTKDNRIDARKDNAIRITTNG